jgi:hypothetical protein
MGDYSLVPVQRLHIENIRCWRNEQLKVLRQAKPLTMKQQQAYFANRIWPEMAVEKPSNILMSFFLRNELIGYGGLVHIAWNDLKAEVSFLLSTDRTNDTDIYNGDFSSFLSLIKIMAFEQLRFRYLFTETYDIRSHHISILENADFIRDGVMHDRILLNGRPVDSILHRCQNPYEK